MMGKPGKGSGKNRKLHKNIRKIRAERFRRLTGWGGDARGKSCTKGRGGDREEK